jgi:hypothetical protein
MTNPNPAAPLTEAVAEQRLYAAYSKYRTHGIHIDKVDDCREYVVGKCFIDAAIAARATSTPAGLDVDLLARALRVVTRGSWSTPARRDPERQKRQDEAWLTRTAGAIAREYVALQGADR